MDRKPPLTACGWQHACRSRNKGFNNCNKTKQVLIGGIKKKPTALLKCEPVANSV